VICFADTDIILKLAACDLLPQTLIVLGVTRQEVYVFREEAYRIYEHDSDARAQYSQETRNRAKRFINNVHGIYGEIAPEEQAFMLAAEIDTGEQAIFGATRDFSDFRVITADRKALRLLTVATGCGGICRRMNGCVLCLEQILLLLMEHFGFAAIHAQVSPHSAHDAAFQEAFPAGMMQTGAEAILKNRITHLRLQTRDLLAP
jgi:hypothetical protein